MGATIAMIGFGLLLLLASLAKAKAKPKKESIEDDIEEALQEYKKEEKGESFWSQAPSPFMQGWAKDDQWEKYVKAQRLGKMRTVTPSNHYGWFLLGPKQLEDLSLMAQVKKNQKGVWEGKWIPPHTQEGWLGNAQGQYHAFARLTEHQAKYIAERYKDKLMNPAGFTIDGKMVTMSGLLGVAKRVGLGGLDKWLSESSEQRKPNTTKEFHRVNAIF